MSLHTHTVSLEVYTVLKQLMGKPFLNSFNLAGGTALSLQIGHRLSVDIDLFTSENFDKEELVKHLQKDFVLAKCRTGDIAVQGFINKTAVDFVYFPYPLIKPLAVDDQIRMVSREDLAAMKLYAVRNSGKRMKDFVDVSYLNRHFTLNEMIGFFKQKFALDEIHVLRTITDFSKLDLSESAVIRLAQGHSYNWGDIEKSLLTMVSNPDSVFQNKPASEKPLVRPKAKWWKF